MGEAGNFKRPAVCAVVVAVMTWCKTRRQPVLCLPQAFGCKQVSWPQGWVVATTLTSSGIPKGLRSKRESH